MEYSIKLVENKYWIFSRYSQIYEIFQEREDLKFLQEMEMKHIFDKMGMVFRNMIKTQELYLTRLEMAYREAYGEI